MRITIDADKDYGDITVSIVKGILHIESIQLGNSTKKISQTEDISQMRNVDKVRNYVDKNKARLVLSKYINLDTSDAERKVEWDSKLFLCVEEFGYDAVLDVSKEMYMSRLDQKAKYPKSFIEQVDTELTRRGITKPDNTAQEWVDDMLQESAMSIYNMIGSNYEMNASEFIVLWNVGDADLFSEVNDLLLEYYAEHN